MPLKKSTTDTKKLKVSTINTEKDTVDNRKLKVSTVNTEKSNNNTKNIKKLNTQMSNEDIIYYDKLWNLNKKQVLKSKIKDINILVKIKTKTKTKTKQSKKIGGYDDNDIIISSTTIPRGPIPRPNHQQHVNNLNLINEVANNYGIIDNNRHHFQTNNRIAYIGIQRNDSVVIRMQDPVNLVDRGHLNIGANYYPHFTFRRNDGAYIRIYFRYNAINWNTFSENITRLLDDAFHNVASTNVTILQSNYAIRDMIEGEYIARIIHLIRNMLIDPNHPLNFRNMQNVGFNHGVGFNPLI